jgi:hypothetical protein
MADFLSHDSGNSSSGGKGGGSRGARNAHNALHNVRSPPLIISALYGADMVNPGWCLLFLCSILSLFPPPPRRHNPIMFPLRKSSFYPVLKPGEGGNSENKDEVE